MRGLRRAIGRILMAMLVIVGLAAAGFLLLCAMVDHYGQRERVQPVDAIVVLGARVLANGEPGPDLLPRIEKATWLYKQGYAAYMVCTGGAAGDAMSAAAIAKRAVVARGVPAQVVAIADGSSSTREDAERTAAIVRANGWRSVVVVTHPLHLLRATVLFRQEGIETYPSPTSTQVQQIPWRWRMYYAAREAALLVFDFFSPDGRLPAWMLRVQRWLQDAGLDEVG